MPYADPTAGLAREGGSAIIAAERTFTETAVAAGTLNATVALPAGATVTNIIVTAVAVWNSSAAVTMIVGDSDPDGFFTAVNLKATDLLAGESISFFREGGKGGAYYAGTGTHWTNLYSATARNIVGTVTLAGTGGTLGRTRMIVEYTLGGSETAATYTAA